MAQKAKKKSKLRHAEYYDMQKTFDSLYADSKRGEVFGHLMDIISAPSNIKLAFRNIKGNDGSHTAGTDGRTIESLAVMPEDKFVKLIQKQFRRYEPKAVKRVEIPKPNGKMRPLGIPCIIDRIVQQCILQVMEPICEAKFYEHSYGFRPCRSAENAISYAYGLAQRNKLHYVVDVDVKGFFDNVDHRKLLKQIWTLGIRDTKLIQIIKAMLKAPIEMPDGETVLPSKGTPQGGILSPLLANIVLNELDWWIASQWDEMVRHMKHPCKVTYYPNGVEKKCNSYTALKKSNLKEMRIVRYADDFKIFCRTKEDAEKTYYAVKDWLWKRLKLEVSDEKSKVTNLRKRDSEFLGFRIKLRRKSNSWVITSNVCGARLAVFDIAELREVTSYDELELDTLGDRKTALFLIMSDTDDSFNFLISMCYTQLFNLLCEKADDVYGGRLPVHVRCLIDECANIGQIPKLEKLVATIRSREISACLVLQAQSQLKAIYKDNADTIIGNMDTSIFLGGKEPTTLKELAAVLGKETIDTYNTGESRGRETSHSLNYQKLGKELMSQDELAVMDGGKCILQLRGVRPFLSDKYDITRHPNFKYTADADKRNTFDIEAFLSARLKLKPDEVCDVYEVDTEGV